MSWQGNPGRYELLVDKAPVSVGSKLGDESSEVELYHLSVGVQIIIDETREEMSEATGHTLVRGHIVDGGFGGWVRQRM